MQETALTLTEETVKLPLLIYYLIKEKNISKRKILRAILKEALQSLLINYLKLGSLAIIIKLLFAF